MADERGGRKTVASNRKARHEFEILDTMEAGLVLKGPEVKSIRDGKVSLAEAFARVDDGEVWLHGMHVTPYDPASRWNVDPTRPRKLLLKGGEIRRLIGATQEKGLTLVPLELYFRRGYAKVALGLARGKKLHDKREALKRRMHQREMEREIRKY
ncbi:MAG TPA: SsrA-binding protein SmpB [Longimicrobiales bacterium]|nr:SsrA-binding protein SmpB [Longimicrobiales bacterium]